MNCRISTLLGAAFLALGLTCAPAADAAARVIKIRSGVDNAMKFDVPTITAAPGETISIVLTNATTLPKEVMGHNWVLLAPGTDPVAFANAGAPEKDNGYIASKMKDKVIAAIRVLGPNETGEVTVKLPSAPGQYPFICSFPGHCATGMKGLLIVK